MRYGLSPDCLPDPGYTRVEASVGLKAMALLPCGLQTAAAVVSCPDNKLVLSSPSYIADIASERCVPAFVTADIAPVDVDSGLIVDGSKMKKDSSIHP